MGFDRCCHGAPNNYHIWIFWSSEITVDLVDCREQQMTIHVGGDPKFRFTLIYAKCNRGERIYLWNHIHQNSDWAIPCFLW